MRMIPAEEFFQELRKRGLEPTEIRTKTGRLWKDGRGWYVSVPEHADTYPDSVLDRILERIGQLYVPPDDPN